MKVIQIIPQVMARVLVGSELLQRWMAKEAAPLGSPARCPEVVVSVEVDVQVCEVCVGSAGIILSFQPSRGVGTVVVLGGVVCVWAGAYTCLSQLLGSVARQAGWGSGGVDGVGLSGPA